MPTDQSSFTNVIPSDAPSVFEALQTLQTSNPTAYNAIVRPNNPPAGIGGFLFDIPEDDEVELNSTISRHFVENNTPISDHIALDPEKVTVRGLVAELVSGIPASKAQQPVPNALPLQGILSGATPTFGQIQGLIVSVQRISANASAVLPNYVSTALGTVQTYYAGGSSITVAQLAAALNTLRQLPNYVGNNPGQIPPTPDTTSALATQQSLYQYFAATAPGLSSLNRQSRAALYFQQAWWGRQIFSVESPWGIWTNMAIKNVKMLQKKDSRYISNFSVIFEKIRVAGDVTTQVGNLAGRNALQQAPQTQNGQAGAGPVDPTLSWNPSFN